MENVNQKDLYFSIHSNENLVRSDLPDFFDVLTRIGELVQLEWFEFPLPEVVSSELSGS